MKHNRNETNRMFKHFRALIAGIFTMMGVFALALAVAAPSFAEGEGCDDGTQDQAGRWIPTYTWGDGGPHYITAEWVTNWDDPAVPRVELKVDTGAVPDNRCIYVTYDWQRDGVGAHYDVRSVLNCQDHSVAQKQWFEPNGLDLHGLKRMRACTWNTSLDLRVLNSCTPLSAGSDPNCDEWYPNHKWGSDAAYQYKRARGGQVVVNDGGNATDDDSRAFGAQA